MSKIPPLGLLPCFFALVLVTACHGPAPESADGARSYTAHGLIEHISPDQHVVTIHHQAIPGYMMK